jgi:hypothetical protein
MYLYYNKGQREMPLCFYWGVPNVSKLIMMGQSKWFFKNNNNNKLDAPFD